VIDKMPDGEFVVFSKTYLKPGELKKSEKKLATLPSFFYQRSGHVDDLEEDIRIYGGLANYRRLFYTSAIML